MKRLRDNDMMILIIIGISLFVYIAISFLLDQIMNVLYKKGFTHVLYAPNKKIYYLLQFTWGLPMNIIGLIVATFLYITKHKPKKHGLSYWFELPIDFGLELGVFFLAPKNASTHTKNHEFGHGIQNIYLGPFTVGAVSIPSAIRFWVRIIPNGIVVYTVFS
jgi:hypothetical protein